MKKIIKRILKIFGGLVAVIIFSIAIFVVTNFTLVKNFPSAQDGGNDAMYIKNQKPLQLVKGERSNNLNVEFAPKAKFSLTHEDWMQTGGKALLVWHKGELVYETYADGISQNDRSRSFSMHKSVLGLIAATMEADGLIDLDDPISQYVEAYKKGGRESLTIRNMLQHETGLERYAFTPPSLDTLNMLLSDRVEKTALKAEIATNDIVFDYSNIGYQVAGAAMRAALMNKTSKTYAEYLSDRLWKPMGGQDAYLWSETPVGAPRFYAGLQASPRDWLKIGIMVAENNGNILPQSAIDTAMTPMQSNAGYGLGVWLGAPEDGLREYGPSTKLKVPSAKPFILPDTVFFDGFGGQRVYISQAEQLVIVRIGDVRFDWDDTALPNLIAASLGIDKAYFDKDITLVAENERAVPVRMLSRTADCSTCKLAIVSHGAFASNQDYDEIAKPLADLGFNVAIPTHPDSKSHPLNGSFDVSKHVVYRLEDHNLILKHTFETQGADTQWIAVGHSFGAMIAANFGGATADDSLVGNAALGLPTHVIALSPPSEVPNAFPAEAFSDLKSPTLLVTGTTDLVPTMIDDWEDHLELYEGAPKGAVKAIVFDNQNHYFNGLYGRIIERNRVAADDDLITLMKSFLADVSLPASDSYRVMP